MSVDIDTEAWIQKLKTLFLRIYIVTVSVHRVYGNINMFLVMIFR